MQKLRLFFALDTPPELRLRIAELSRELQAARADVRWESADKLHCTLKFLGDTDESQVPAVKAAAHETASAVDPPPVRYATLGCFPSRNAPRVVWVGIEDLSGALARLHDELDRALDMLGFEREERSFRPHVTLGRVKGTRNLHHLIRALETLTFDSEPTTLSALRLVKSDLHPSGSVYTTIQEFPFGLPRL
jgi:RNA 2',3'-cyclic 3'-phosphodiesterase